MSYKLKGKRNNMYIPHILSHFIDEKKTICEKKNYRISFLVFLLFVKFDFLPYLILMRGRYSKGFDTLFLILLHQVKDFKFE